MLLTEDHVAMRKLFKFGTLRNGAEGTGGRPMVCWRGVDVPLGSRDVVDPETSDRLFGGEYGGTASGYGATEW